MLKNLSLMFGIELGKALRKALWGVPFTMISIVAGVLSWMLAKDVLSNELHQELLPLIAFTGIMVGFKTFTGLDWLANRVFKKLNRRWTSLWFPSFLGWFAASVFGMAHFLSKWEWWNNSENARGVVSVLFAALVVAVHVRLFPPQDPDECCGQVKNGSTDALRPKVGTKDSTLN